MVTRGLAAAVGIACLVTAGLVLLDGRDDLAGHWPAARGQVRPRPDRVVPSLGPAATGAGDVWG